jgi:hypothetical protein
MIIHEHLEVAVNRQERVTEDSNILVAQSCDFEAGSSKAASPQ